MIDMDHYGSIYLALCFLFPVFSGQAAFLPEGFSNLGSTKLHQGITLDLKVAKSKLDSWKKKFRIHLRKPCWMVVSFVFLMFIPYLGKIPILTNIFQMG